MGRRCTDTRKRDIPQHPVGLRRLETKFTLVNHLELFQHLRPEGHQFGMGVHHVEPREVAFPGSNLRLKSKCQLAITRYMWLEQITDMS